MGAQKEKMEMLPVCEPKKETTESQRRYKKWLWRNKYSGKILSKEIEDQEEKNKIKEEELKNNRIKINTNVVYVKNGLSQKDIEESDLDNERWRDYWNIEKDNELSEPFSDNYQEQAI